jgi:hypothetical protein
MKRASFVYHNSSDLEFDWNLIVGVVLLRLFFIRTCTINIFQLELLSIVLFQIYPNNLHISPQYFSTMQQSVHDDNDLIIIASINLVVANRAVNYFFSPFWYYSLSCNLLFFKVYIKQDIQLHSSFNGWCGFCGHKLSTTDYSTIYRSKNVHKYCVY